MMNTLYKHLLSKPAKTTLMTLLIANLFCNSLSYAHTPYLVPSRFEPLDNGLITLDAAFAEHFFVPDVAFDSDKFSATNPDGTRVKADAVHRLKSRTVLEHTLEQDGTYRFSTGHRYGAVFTTYEQEGETLTSRNSDFTLPNDARLIEQFQSVTLAETYISKGAPTNTALQSRNKGLEIVPQSHPNELFVGDEFTFKTLFNGKALDSARVDIFRARYQFGTDKPDITLHTLSNGMASFKATEEGIYLLQIRHRAPAPAGSAAPLYSNTYTLVIEVID